MEQQQTAAPVDHGVLSTTGNVALGTAGGAAKGAVKAGAGWIAGLTVLGAVIGLAVLAPAGGAFATVAWFTGGGAVLGVLTSPFAGVLGSVVGGFTGAGKSVRQVSAEKGAANVVQAQVSAYQAQAQAEAMAAAASAQAQAPAPVQFPPQGAPMNPASTKLYAANDNAYANDNGLEHQGTVTAQRQIQQG